MWIASTQRLEIRTFCDADVESLTSVFGDPEVMRFGDGPQSVDWIRLWLAQAERNYDQWGFGQWAIVLHGSDSPIGYCGLTRFDDINGQPEVELGFRLAKEHWRRGLATEATAAVRDLAFRQLGVERLIALIDPNNYRSIRVAQKLGMVHTGDVMLPGYTYPDRVYSVANRQT